MTSLKNRRQLLNGSSIAINGTVFSSNDVHWMRQALCCAELAQKLGEVPIGAVVVQGSEILGMGWNQPIAAHDPTAHAEIVALRQAAVHVGNYRLPPGTILYSTLEPCAMCAGALLSARVSRLVYGALDPRAGAVASALHLLDVRSLNHQVEWEGGCLAEEATALLQAFFRDRRGGITKIDNSAKT